MTDGKPESFPIDKIYVPVKTKKALKSDLVEEIAESILDIGQQTPILVRADGERFILVHGLHRLEACKALGEDTIIGVLVSAEMAHHKSLLFESAEAEAEREKMARLRRLRLEKEAAATSAVSTTVTDTKSAQSLPKRSRQDTRNNPKTSDRSSRRTSGSTPKTLSEWIVQQKRDGGRY